MTDPCSCSPGACHGGHTIDEDRLRHIRDGWVTRGNETLEMAAELLAARARLTELETADREHSQLIEYLNHAHGIDIDREDDDFREWQQQYGADRG